jgi:predicted Zn-dependent protease with MMP-like domain
MASIKPPAVDWIGRKAPTLAEFEALAEVAYRRLPESFLRACEGLVIKIEDFPDEDTLLEFEAETEFELLGLFRGAGLSQIGEIRTGQFPNMVFLFRRPILDTWAEGDETLGDLVKHVLVHEIGHHFGLSDEDMERVEQEAN